MNSIGRYAQCDPHRRTLDDKTADEHIVALAQAKRNHNEWLRRAKEAIDDGYLNIARNCIDQAEREWQP